MHKGSCMHKATLSSNSHLVDVVIIGGGLSGLSTGYFAHKNHKSYVILEKTNQIGGVLGSEKKSDYLLEKSAHTLVYSPIFKRIITDLGLEGRLIFARDCVQERLIFYHQQLHSIPTSISKIFLSALLGFTHKIRLIRGFYRQSATAQEQTIHAFFKHYFGKHITELFVDAMVSGVWAGDIHRLSMDACFPSIKKAVLQHRLFFQAVKNIQQHKPQIFSFQEGSGEFIHALGQYCAPYIRQNQDIQSIVFDQGHQYFRIQSQNAIYHAKKIIVCTPINELPVLFKTYLENDSLIALHRLCQSVAYVPLQLIYSTYKKKSLKKAILDKLHSFGFLIPRSQHKKILGCIVNSALFPNRCPSDQILLTTFIGGEHFQEVNQLDQQSLYRLVNQELESILSVPKPVWQHRIAWQRAIPQYYLGHQRTIDRIKTIINHPNILFNANWHEGTAIAKIIEKSSRILM